MPATRRTTATLVLLGGANDRALLKHIASVLRRQGFEACVAPDHPYGVVLLRKGPVKIALTITPSLAQALLGENDDSVALFVTKDYGPGSRDLPFLPLPLFQDLLAQPAPPTLCFVGDRKLGEQFKAALVELCGTSANLERLMLCCQEDRLEFVLWKISQQFQPESMAPSPPPAPSG